MFFLKKRHLDNPESQENTENTPHQDSNNENSQPPQKHNLLGRLSLFQSSHFIPDAPYENEAWAPEITTVGLFHKHWSIEEEQISSSSGPQLP